MAGEIDWEIEPRRKETFLVKMLKEFDEASRKGEAKKEKECSRKKG